MLVAVLYSILWILAAFKLADRNWKPYYPTILFASLSNLLYELICYNYQLWQMEPNGVKYAMIPILLLCLIGMPLSTWVYLSHYPADRSLLQRFKYILLFTALFVVLEYISVKLGAITYHNRWNLLWSTLFDIIMFIMLRVHFRNPLIGIACSVVYTGLLIVLFNVTLEKMK
ncbi:CBO0543 family protein [Paenibacillus sp. GCM10027628]|uniref:CBO0543 family protein n=1 Tax=Paenibacillus sp. GCM10027628 TaxID=3273413 RepID=UPI00362D537C